MFELFDEVFEEVKEEVGATGWWEVYSNHFGTVYERIAERIGITTDELDEREDFREWDDEMALDL